MAYVSGSGESVIFQNSCNLLFYNQRPNGKRPLISGNNTVLKWLHEQPEFSNFLSLVYISNMNEELDNIMCNMTLFVPTNDALNKYPNLLCELSRSKARSFVKHHITKDVPLCLSNIANSLMEVKNYADISMTIDGRRTPFRVGYNNLGGAFGLDWNVIANIASHKEFYTKNGVIHPIDDCIFPTTEILG